MDQEIKYKIPLLYKASSATGKPTNAANGHPTREATATIMIDKE